jgi:transcriptional regulator with XRE-family HTH domain
MKTLGQYIREVREAKDMSVREFARRLGDLSPPFVSDVELGRRFPSDKVLAKMAHILGVTVDELQRHDSRPPLEELKRMAASDPVYGFALRKIADGEISAEDLMKFTNRKTDKNR